MTLGTGIMFGVAAVFALIGAYLLLSLTRPSGPAKVYVYRMVGIMALSAGVLLAISAWFTWGWSTTPDPALSSISPE